MTDQEFEKLLDTVAQTLTIESQEAVFRSSKEFENRVREVLAELGGERLAIDFAPHPYVFPDIAVGAFGVMGSEKGGSPTVREGVAAPPRNALASARASAFVSLYCATTPLPERELQRVRQLFQEHWLQYFPAQQRNHWQTDVVNLFRPHTKCLPDTQYVHKANNKVPGNKPVGIGYPLSFVNRADFPSRWSLPFALHRVKSSEDGIEVGARQPFTGKSII